MKKVPSWNPFDKPDPFPGKSPESMSVDELEIYLHFLRADIQLQAERLRSDLKFGKWIWSALAEAGFSDYLQEFLSDTQNGPKSD